MSTEPPAKRARFHALKPLSPEVPHRVSPLYSVLVPHGNTSGVDYAMAEPYLRYEGLVNDNSWYRHRGDYRRLQWIVDLIQLSHTCKHAHYFMVSRQLAKVFLDAVNQFKVSMLSPALRGVLGNGLLSHEFHRALGAPVDQFQRGHASINHLRHGNPAMSAFVAAYLNRIAVARWWTPPHLRLHYRAIRDLALPLEKRNLAPGRYWFTSRPFFLPAGMAPGTPPLSQSLLWLALGLRLAHPGITAEALVWMAGKKRKALEMIEEASWMGRNLPQNLATADRVCSKFFAGRDAVQRKLALSNALAECAPVVVLE